MPESAATPQPIESLLATGPSADLRRRLLATCRLVNSSVDPDLVLDALVAGARDLLQASQVAAYYRVRDTQTLRRMAWAAADGAADPPALDLPLADSLPALAIRRATTLLAPPTPGEPARLAIPLEIHGEPRGALTLCRPQNWTDDELWAAEALAQSAAAALHTARTHAHLRERERELSQLSDALQEGVWRVDAAGITDYVNPRLAVLLGYRPEELLGRPVTDFMDAQSAAENADTKRRRRAGQADRYRCTLVHRDGTPVPVEISSGPLYDRSGAYAGSLAAVSDLRERMAWDERLRQSEDRFRSLYDEMTSGSVIYAAVDDGADFMTVDVNRAAEEMDGYHAEELIGQRVSAAMPPDVREQLLEPLRRVWRTGQPERLEPFYWEAEHGRGWRRNRVFRLPNGEVVTIFNDATASIEARRAADRHAALLDAIVQVQQEALTSNNEAQLSEATLRVAEGLTSSAYGWIGEYDATGGVSTLGVSPLGWATCDIPLDQAEARLRGQLLRGVRRLVLEQGRTVIVEDAAHDPRLAPMPAGHPPIQRLIAAPIRWEGQVHALIGLANKPSPYDQADVQALEALGAACGQALLRLRDGVALRRSEETLRVLLDAPDDTIMLMDTDGRLLALNEAANARLSRQYGLSEETALGQSVWDLLPSSVAALRQRVANHVLTEGETVTWEDELYGIAFENNVYPICDPNGRVERIAYIGRDITEQRRQEEARERRRSALERLYRTALELNRPQTVDDLALRIIRGAEQVLSADRVALKRIDPQTGDLVMLACTSAGLSDQTTVPRERGICGWAIREGRAVQVDDYAAWCGAVPPYVGWGLRRAAAIPLYVGKELLGAMAIGCSDRAGPYSDEELQLLSLYGAQAALALQNARLLSEAREAARTNLRLAQEVSHRVKNNLSSVLALIEGERATARDDPETRMAFERLAGRVRGLAAVHGLLAGDGWQTVSLAKLLPQVIGTVARAVPRDKTLDVLYDCEEVPVTADQARAVALIANELATNVAKHALAERSDVHVLVRARAARGRVRVCIRDDGPGCEPEALSGEGFDLVHELVRSELHGRLCARDQDGLIVTIIFPLTRQRYRKDGDAQS